MHIAITLYGLSDIEKECFQRELYLLQADIQSDILREVRKRKNDRNWGTRLIQAMEQRFLGSPVSSINLIIEQMEQIGQHPLITYEIENNDDALRADITLHGDYFKMLRSLQVWSFQKQIERNVIKSKNDFVKTWEKIAKRYSKQHSVDVIDWGPV